MKMNNTGSSKILEIFGFAFASFMFFSILFFSTYKSFRSYKISILILAAVFLLTATADIIIQKFGKWQV